MTASFVRVLNRHLDDVRYVYGFADLRGLLSGPYADYGYGVSIVRHLDNAIIDGIAEAPTRAYFDHYHAINRELNGLVEGMVAELRELGHDCKGVLATATDQELDADARAALRYPVSHKQVATRAGLGWIGKTDLLITERFGPRVRLSSILTKSPLETTQPIDASRCGSCSLCVTRCPAKAASGLSWDTSVPREAFFDPFACRAYCLKISAQALNEKISICGRCVNVCPYGKKECAAS